MASYTRTEVNSRFLHLIWTLSSGDATGNSVKLGGASDKSVQFKGDFDGATVVLEGSNVVNPSGDSDWFTLHNEVGDDLSFEAAGGGAVTEMCLHYRTKLTGGTAPDVDVILFCRSTR